MSIPSPQNRRLSPGRPRPTHHRLKHEAAFVKENDATTFPPGVFLYAANAACATARLPFRPAPERGALASDSSSPDAPIAARRGQDDTERQTSSRSRRPRVSVSRVPWDIRQLAGRAGATPGAACTGRPTASAGVPASDEGKALLDRFVGRPDTIGAPNSPKPLRRVPPTKGSRPLRVTLQPGGAAAPTPAGSLEVSCCAL
jgi:hypothetical protein